MCIQSLLCYPRMPLSWGMLLTSIGRCQFGIQKVTRAECSMLKILSGTIIPFQSTLIAMGLLSIPRERCLGGTAGGAIPGKPSEQTVIPF